MALPSTRAAVMAVGLTVAAAGMVTAGVTPVGVVRVLAAGAATSPPGAACPVFPADNVWNADVSGLPVNTNSSAWMA
ncbi:MAG TPA: hypothetical protein VGI06_06715, partial [Acidimicrobiales bacterium]